MHRRGAGLLLAILISAFASADEPTIPATERTALVALFISTNGDAWANRRGWLGPEGTECNWFGVFCTGDEERLNVIGLSLANNGLSGSIPGSLLKLTFLQVLNLAHNRLTGPIPSLSALRSLRSVNLRDNI